MRPPSDLRKFMCSTAIGAGQILASYLGRKLHIREKKGAGIVTQVDEMAEDYVLKKIFKKFPQSSIITEEAGEYEGSSEAMWILDPLDGTSNFAHGFPWFCVSMGLYWEGKPKAGVIYQPVLKELFYGEVGKGAFLNGKRLKVSKTSALSKALVGTGFYYMKDSQLRKEMAIFAKMNELAQAVRRPGSAALDLAYVAAGRYDGFWEKGLAPWDVAAGMIIVEEAGGKITDYSGKKTDIFAKNLVASNTKLHPSIIRVIQRNKK